MIMEDEPPQEYDGQICHIIAPWELELGSAVSFQDTTVSFNSYNVVQSAANFYLLEAVASNTIEPKYLGVQPIDCDLFNAMLAIVDLIKIETSRITLRHIIGEASRMLAEQVKREAPIIQEYLHYAIGTELSYTSTVDVSDESAWWLEIVDEFGPEKACKWALNIIKNTEWDAQYGGDAWDFITNILHSSYTGSYASRPFTLKDFMDRAFSLQHNTSTIFNKTYFSCSLCDLQTVLDAQNEGDWETLLEFASHDVKQLFYDYKKMSKFDPSQTGERKQAEWWGECYLTGKRIRKGDMIIEYQNHMILEEAIGKVE